MSIPADHTTTLQQLKELLREECKYQLPSHLTDLFLSKMEEVFLRKGEILTDAGDVDRNIYIVKEGIVAHTYFSGTKECCWGFSLPGTLHYSLHAYYFNEPSFYRVEACCDTIELKMRKETFDSLIREHHEFAQWVLSMAQCQLYFFEKKNRVIEGDAREKFEALLRNRPEILENVPQKIIASYLGVTRQYLCNLKRRLM